MKIVFLTHDMNPKSGWGRYASDLIYGVKNAGHDVIILKEQDDGFEGAPILKRGFGIFSSALKIKKFVRVCDVIHALDGYPYGIIGAMANLGAGKKLVITGVGTYAVAPLYGSSAFLMKWAYKKANKVLTISNYTKREILKKIDLKVEIIRPGIKTYLPVGNTQVRGNIILSVGTLKWRKGYHVSIPAFALAKKKILDLRYKIVGNQRDIGYFLRLQELAKRYGVENDIEFISDISDDKLLSLYREASIFILTSVNHDHHFEGFGIVFLEAAASGLPCIGTKGNGIEDAIDSYRNGYLVDQNDVENTAKAIINILSDENKWLAMSKNSYEWAKKNHKDLMVARYLELYKNL